MGHMQDGMGWWMVFGSTLWILFIIALIVAFSSLIRPFIDRRNRSDSPQGDDAVEIARKRYASGEIGREEYEQILDDLRLSEAGRES